MVAKEHGEERTLSALLKACKELDVDIHEKSPGKALLCSF